MSRAPELTPHKAAERAAREERSAQALRDNLRRRKAQARAQARHGEGIADDAAALSGAPPSGKSNRHGGTAAD
jgi:hypothetical protein